MTSYPNEGRKLRGLLQMLLKRNLAKCIKVIDYAKSYYIWEGKLKKTQEKILLIKFAKEQKEELESALKKAHPYEVPELIYLAPEEVEEKYLHRIRIK